MEFPVAPDTPAKIAKKVAHVTLPSNSVTPLETGAANTWSSRKTGTGSSERNTKERLSRRKRHSVAKQWSLRVLLLLRCYVRRLSSITRGCIRARWSRKSGAGEAGSLAVDSHHYPVTLTHLDYNGRGIARRLKYRE